MKIMKIVDKACMSISYVFSVQHYYFDTAKNKNNMACKGMS